MAFAPLSKSVGCIWVSLFLRSLCCSIDLWVCLPATARTVWLLSSIVFKIRWTWFLLLIFFKIVLAIPVPLSFHADLRVILTYKNFAGILIENGVKPVYQWRIYLFTMLSFPNHEFSILLLFRSLIFFKRFYLLCLERGGGREKEREINIDQLPLAHPQKGTWPATQGCALTGKGASDLLVCCPVLGPLSRTSQG